MVNIPSRIPVSRSFLIHTTPTPAPEAVQEALRLRLTCSTPTFNTSTKLSHLPTSPAPVAPAMQRGEGIGNLRQYTDYRTSLEEDSSPSGTLSRKSSSSSLGSRFRLKLRPSRSRSSLLSSSDGSCSDGRSSRCSSVLAQKPLPPLPALFSPCTSPMDEYLHDDANESFESTSPPPTHSSAFKIRRKPVPEYLPESDDVPTLDFDSSSSSSSDDDENHHPVQRIAPNIFLTSDGDSWGTLTSAFTHIVRISPGDAVERAHITFDPETRVHTLNLPIPSPAAPLHIADTSDIASNHFSLIDKPHHGMDFSPRAGSSQSKFKIHRKPVPQLDAFESGSSGESNDLNDDSESDLITSFPMPRRYTHADLVTTQRFLGMYGHHMSLCELGALLSDELDPEPAPGAAPLGLQPSDIETALAFLRPHPFSPHARRRVLMVAPRGQGAREAVALVACYLAAVEGYTVRSAVRSLGKASRAWTGLRGRGDEDCLAAYLGDVWGAEEANIRF